MIGVGFDTMAEVYARKGPIVDPKIEAERVATECVPTEVGMGMALARALSGPVGELLIRKAQRQRYL